MYVLQLCFYSGYKTNGGTVTHVKLLLSRLWGAVRYLEVRRVIERVFQNHCVIYPEITKAPLNKNNSGNL